MPEGPSVKKFYTLAFPFVGRFVVKVAGSTKQINLKDVNGCKFQDCQVHGKNLFLAFGSDLQSAANDDLPREGLEAGPSPEDTVHPQGNSVMLKDNEQEMSKTVGRNQTNKNKASNELARGRTTCKWLRFHFGMYGSIRANEFARTKQANKRGDWKDPAPRLVLNFDDGGFLAFYNCRMDWCSRPVIKPASDILSAGFHRGQALEALRNSRPVCFTLLDQRYFSGLGNIIKNEILFLAGIHPLTPGSLLGPKTLETIVDHAIRFTSDWLHNKLQGIRMHHQIYLKDICPLGHLVMKDNFGPPGGLQRPTWWCPECQPQIPINQVESA
ncbi:endonuclease 8-like 2 [Pleurodeles waltl]